MMNATIEQFIPSEVSWEAKRAFANAYLSNEISGFEYELLKSKIIGDEFICERIENAKIHSDDIWQKEFLERAFENKEIHDLEEKAEKITIEDFGIPNGLQRFLSSTATSAIEHAAWTTLFGVLGIHVDEEMIESEINSLFSGDEAMESVMSGEEQTTEQNGFFNSSGWETANEACKDLAEEAGAATEAIYSAGGVAGTVVGQHLGQTVEENWEHVCNLPENVHDAFKGGDTSGVYHTPDSGMDGAGTQDSTDSGAE